MSIICLWWGAGSLLQMGSCLMKYAAGILSGAGQVGIFERARLSVHRFSIMRLHGEHIASRNVKLPNAHATLLQRSPAPIT